MNIQKIISKLEQYYEDWPTWWNFVGTLSEQALLNTTIRNHLLKQNTSVVRLFPNPTTKEIIKMLSAVHGVTE